MPGQTVAIHFVRAVVSAVDRQRGDVDSVLTRAGISRSLLEFDRARLTTAQASALIRGLWRVTGDEFFGLGPLPLPVGSLKMMSLALIHLGDLGAVLGRFCEFSRVLPGVPTARARLGPTTSRFELDTGTTTAEEALAVDAVLFMAHRFAGWLIGTRVGLSRVELPHPRPEYVQEYDLVFGCPVRFGTESAALVFDSGALSAPIVRDEVDLLTFLRHSPIDLLVHRDSGTSTAGQVRKILERGLRGPWPLSEEVAARLSLSLQHVRRLLRDEGTSISEIKDDILRDAAIASLVRGEEPVAELSGRLGFSEPSAFRRAFRRWTGSAPGSYRRGGEDGLAAG
jgi:AraC-like DNA-binding protein